MQTNSNQTAPATTIEGFRDARTGLMNHMARVQIEATVRRMVSRNMAVSVGKLLPKSVAHYRIRNFRSGAANLAAAAYHIECRRMRNRYHPLVNEAMCAAIGHSVAHERMIRAACDEQDNNPTEH